MWWFGFIASDKVAKSARGQQPSKIAYKIYKSQRFLRFFQDFKRFLGIFKISNILEDLYIFWDLYKSYLKVIQGSASKKNRLTYSGILLRGPNICDICEHHLDSQKFLLVTKHLNSIFLSDKSSILSVYLAHVIQNTEIQNPSQVFK